MKITLIHTAGATCPNYTTFASLFFVVESAFIDTSSSVGRTRQSKTSCFELSSKFLFERVWVTQGLLCIPPGIVLDKTPSISERKFRMKSLTSFDFFEKASSLGSEGTTQEGARQLGRTSWKKRLITSKLPSSEIWVSIAYEIITPPILSWPCSGSQLLGILEMSLSSTSKRLWLSTSPHTPCIHICCGLIIAV